MRNYLSGWMRTMGQFEKFPWLPGEVCPLQFASLVEQREQIMEDLETVVMREFGDDPEIQDVLLYTNRLEEVINRLPDALDTDGLLERAMEKMGLDSPLVSAWSSSAIGATSPLLAIVQGGVQLKDEELYIPWAVAVDSYCRDFELLFEYVIRPCLYGETGRSQTFKEDLSEFLEPIKVEDPVLWKRVGQIIQPRLRNRLIRHEYYIDFKTQEAVLHADGKLKGRTSLDEIQRTSTALNEFLWVLIAVFYDIWPDELVAEGSPAEIMSRQTLRKFRDHPLYLALKNAMQHRAWEHKPRIFRGIDMTIIPQQILDEDDEGVASRNSDDKANHDETIKVIPGAFVESFWYRQVLDGKIANGFPMDMNIASMAEFLVFYDLVGKVCLIPIAESVSEGRISGWSEHRRSEHRRFANALDAVKSYRNGEFSSVFRGMDIEVRHVIAHRQYFYLDGNLYPQYITLKGELRKVPLLTELAMVFGFMSTAFSDWDYARWGLARLLFFLIRSPTSIPYPKYFIQAAGALRQLQDREGHRIYIVLAELAHGLLRIEDGDMQSAVSAFQRANDDGRNVPRREQDIIWSWVLLRGKTACPTMFETGLKEVYWHYKHRPLNKQAHEFHSRVMKNLREGVR